MKVNFGKEIEHMQGSTQDQAAGFPWHGWISRHRVPPGPCDLDEPGTPQDPLPLLRSCKLKFSSLSSCSCQLVEHCYRTVLLGPSLPAGAVRACECGSTKPGLVTSAGISRSPGFS